MAVKIEAAEANGYVIVSIPEEHVKYMGIHEKSFKLMISREAYAALIKPDEVT